MRWASAWVALVLVTSLAQPAPQHATSVAHSAPGAAVRLDYHRAHPHPVHHTRTPVVVASQPRARATSRYATRALPIRRFSLSLVAMAKCIRSHESGVYTRDTGNGYFGAYQMSDKMWHGQTGLSGHASDYPKAVQDYWFMRIWSKLKTDRVRQQQWSTYRYCH